MRMSHDQTHVRQIHSAVHFLANCKARGALIPLSTTALMKWHKESASDLIHRGLRHLSPLERHHIEGPIGAKF